ncbi:LCP family glycopolymer transferase [Streptosporangium sp. NBC_01756]|uniref:LCP family glycopolymer transferase n=1 Tax=Streptosporangium sp. NBC_01756 TaxID=2975950 RepID=UPI002DD8BA72|nr:LCP family protein [Streptosporangium sp. NBC_01756]WSC89727.1 LCP family protein [Streptosporangium sp. NBC_01756]
MDDLKMLRDLGRDLEYEPPATLARQRQRLLGAGTGRGPRWTRLLGAGTGGGPRRARHWTMIGLAAVVTAAIALVPALLLGGHQAVSVLSGHRTVPTLVGDRPDKRTEALNILLVGTDSEVGTPRYRTPGARSDTMLLLHLPADRVKVTVISIPRDSMVRIPSCGPDTPARTEMINSAFRMGGLACAWKTVESLTGVRVDHAVELDFSGFAGLVDAVGGVEVTLPRAVDDPKAKLRLSAGKHMLSGKVALAYVRARYSMGDGSDISRIKRQQQLMSALAKKVKTLLADPARLRPLLTEAATWVKTDAGLDLETMYEIAGSLAKTDLGTVPFVTVPWRPHPEDKHRIQWAQPAAEKLFASIR